MNDDYLALFKYSDALIHDCGSFTIEYLYMDNPVMFLTLDEHHADNLNATAKKAYSLHYKGRSRIDIEEFVVSVIKFEW